MFGKINSCGFLDKEPPAPPVVEEEGVRVVLCVYYGIVVLL